VTHGASPLHSRLIKPQQQQQKNFIIGIAQMVFYLVWLQPERKGISESRNGQAALKGKCEKKDNNNNSGERRERGVTAAKDRRERIQVAQGP
jgi:hypothetical protein